MTASKPDLFSVCNDTERYISQLEIENSELKLKLNESEKQLKLLTPTTVKSMEQFAAIFDKAVIERGVSSLVLNFKKALISRSLVRHYGNQRKVADETGLCRNTVARLSR